MDCKSVNSFLIFVHSGISINKPTGEEDSFSSILLLVKKAEGVRQR